MRPRPPAIRIVLVGARMALGAWLLVSPDRVLGMRQLVEGAVLARHARRPPPEWSIAVDALHGLSMVALAVARPGLRPAAVRSAASALALTALSAYER